MKAILKFDLTNPDDVIEFNRANASANMAAALWQIVYNTKKGIGHQLEGVNKDGTEYSAYDALNLVYDRIYEILDENNVNVDSLN